MQAMMATTDFFFVSFDLWKWDNPVRITDFQTGLYASLVVPQNTSGLLLLPPPQKSCYYEIFGGQELNFPAFN